MKISIVIPTRNEEENIASLLSYFNFANKKLQYETVVVDDSSDRTAEIAERNGAKVVRGKRQGLGQAIIDGIEASRGDVVVVMDSDGQHRPEDVPKLLKPVLEEGADLAIGSRYVKGGSNPEWSLTRRIISRGACLLALPITHTRDATSGFFAFRKDILKGVELCATSWKVMLEVLIKANPTKVVEVPITFEERTSGESKFNTKQVVAYLKHLVSLTLYKYRRLVKFGLIGASGAVIHFGLLYMFTDVVGLFYMLSAVCSIGVASTSNYILNHKWTFKERAISNHVLGWGKYQVLSGISDVIYLGLLALTVEVIGMWYMAGAVLSVLIIFPVKFGVASTFIWREEKNADAADYDWNSFYKGTPIQKWWKRSIAKTVWNWIPNSSSLLNVGCGSSPIAVKYPTSTCIDVNVNKLDFLKEKLPNITTEVMPAGALSYVDESFDYVLCIEVLEHISEPSGAISEMVRVLKSGGKIVLATPDYSRKHWLIAEKFTPAGEQHVYKFTRKALEETCEQYGLRSMRHKYVAGCDLVELFTKE